MSKGSVWKTRCVGFKSLPSRIYSRRCRMQHRFLYSRPQFAKRSNGFTKFLQPRRTLIGPRWRILSSHSYLVRSYYKNMYRRFEISKHEKGVTKIRYYYRGVGSKHHFSKMNGEIVDNAYGSAIIEASERMTKAALLQKEIYKKNCYIFRLYMRAQVYSHEISDFRVCRTLCL